jgi:hypothetical protein
LGGTLDGLSVTNFDLISAAAQDARMLEIECEMRDVSG